MGMQFFILAFLGLFLVAISPFSLGGTFFSLLVLRSLAVGITRGLLGLILFIVYVGGTIVLFTYCFMLSPRQIFSFLGHHYPIIFGALGGFFLVRYLNGPSSRILLGLQFVGFNWPSFVYCNA